ncbi:hypothetical protein RCH09_002581 [Actimicrobium sp. GrIS 1.19]|nr:hypothetical protein [Actimicrobium sp. GrIS 1.19]
MKKYTAAYVDIKLMPPRGVKMAILRYLNFARVVAWSTGIKMPLASQF